MFTFSVPATNTPTHIVVWQDSTASSSTNVVMLSDRIAALENAISKIGTPSPSPPPPVTALDSNTPLISGISMRRRDDSIGSLSALHPPDVRNILNALINPPVSLELNASEPMEVDHVSSADAEADADADADVEETSQLDADAEEEDADADADAEEEEAEEDADAEEGIELEEFEYKGETYYKDAENLVYKMDADGDLDDQPIGIWNEEKKKVLKYSKA